MNLKQLGKWQIAVGAIALVAVGLLLGPAQATTNTAQSNILAQSTFPTTTMFSHGQTLSGHPWLTFLQTLGLTDGYVVDNKVDVGQTNGGTRTPDRA